MRTVHKASRTFSDAGGRMYIYLVFIIFLLWAATTTKTILPVAGKVTVHVINNVTYRSPRLLVHCRSGDHDVGAQNVTFGEQYAFSFEPNYFHTTLFGCHMEPDSYYHVDIVAWKEVDDLYPYSGEVYWVAGEDAVHGKNGTGDQFYYYDWVPTV